MKTIHSSAPTPQSWVIIATFAGNSEYFRQCLESVLSQTQQPDDIVVIFDIKAAEHKKTTHHIAEFETIIADLLDNNTTSVLENNSMMWASSTKNVGIQELHDRNIPLAFFLDDDDMRHPDKCRQQLEIVNNIWIQEFGALWCHSDLINDDGEIFSTTRYALHRSDILSTIRNPFNMSTMLTKTELLVALGWFDPFLYTSQDRDLYQRLLRTYPDLHYENIDKSLTIYRYHSWNTSHLHRFDQRLRGLQQSLDYYLSSKHKTKLDNIVFIAQRLAMLWIPPSLIKKLRSLINPPQQQPNNM